MVTRSSTAKNGSRRSARASKTMSKSAMIKEQIANMSEIQRKKILAEMLMGKKPKIMSTFKSGPSFRR